MTGDYLPFTYPDKATSKFRGFDVDMADDALGRRAPPMGLQRSWLR
jgi:cyclohexadienyl dehydratase